MSKVEKFIADNLFVKVLDDLQFKRQVSYLGAFLLSGISIFSRGTCIGKMSLALGSIFTGIYYDIAHQKKISPEKYTKHRVHDDSVNDFVKYHNIFTDFRKDFSVFIRSKIPTIKKN